MSKRLNFWTFNISRKDYEISGLDKGSLPPKEDAKLLFSIKNNQIFTNFIIGHHIFEFTDLFKQKGSLILERTLPEILTAQQIITLQITIKDYVKNLEIGSEIPQEQIRDFILNIPER